MRFRHGFISLGFVSLGLLLTLAAAVLSAAEKRVPKLKVGEFNPDHETVDLFQAMKDGTVAVKYIPENANAANLLIENKTKQPLNVKLPDAFAGVPVLAQFGGGGGQGGGGQGGGGQAQGGGGGGGMGGGQGGGMFNVAPEKVGQLKLATVCLEHGKPDPTPRMAYEIKPIETVTQKPAVIALLKEFGRGKLNHSAAQAAAWHLNNDMSWQELAGKKIISRKYASGSKPYFSQAEVQAGFLIAKAATEQAKATSTSPGAVSQSLGNGTTGAQSAEVVGQQ